MSAETRPTRKFEKTTSQLGTAMMLGWTFGIGIVGFVLLSVIAYALASQDLNLMSLVVVSVLLLFAPPLMTVFWGALASTVFAKEEPSAVGAFSGPSWWELRQPHRVIYQAYFH
jgi:hypothetical protein